MNRTLRARGRQKKAVRPEWRYTVCKVQCTARGRECEMESIYTASGLKAVAELLDDVIERQELFSQNALGLIAGVSPNTIGLIRSNNNLTQANFEKGKGYNPQLTTLLKLAKFIPDPLTGRPFDMTERPVRLERIARGWEELKPSGAKKSPPSLIDVPNAKAVAYISQAANKNPQAFAKAGLPVDGPEFTRLLSGEFPSFPVLGKLQIALKFKGLEELTDLYGLSPDEPIKPKHENGCTNGCT